jgi:hypothetical protein
MALCWSIGQPSAFRSWQAALGDALEDEELVGHLLVS